MPYHSRCGRHLTQPDTHYGYIPASGIVVLVRHVMVLLRFSLWGTNLRGCPRISNKLLFGDFRVSGYQLTRFLSWVPFRSKSGRTLASGRKNIEMDPSVVRHAKAKNKTKQKRQANKQKNKQILKRCDGVFSKYFFFYYFLPSPPS